MESQGEFLIGFLASVGMISCDGFNWISQIQVPYISYTTVNKTEILQELILFRPKLMEAKMAATS